MAWCLTTEPGSTATALPESPEAHIASLSDTGRAKLKELRTTGIDPSQTGEAAEKRRTTMQQRRTEEAEWDATYPGTEVDESVFTDEILKTLETFSLKSMSSASGLSQQYCSLVRRGLKVPHPWH